MRSNKHNVITEHSEMHREMQVYIHWKRRMRLVHPAVNPSRPRGGGGGKWLRYLDELLRNIINFVSRRGICENKSRRNAIINSLARSSSTFARARNLLIYFPLLSFSRLRLILFPRVKKKLSQISLLNINWSEKL